MTQSHTPYRERTGCQLYHGRHGWTVHSIEIFIFPFEKQCVSWGYWRTNIFKTGSAVSRERPGQRQRKVAVAWLGEAGHFSIFVLLLAVVLRRQPCTGMEGFHAASPLLSLLTGHLLTAQSSLAFLVLSCSCFLRVQILTQV